jgi:hypothetical protein
VIKIKFPVSDEVADSIIKTAMSFDTSNDVIMRAAVDQTLHEGLDNHILSEIKDMETSNRLFVRLPEDAYAEVFELAMLNGTTRAVYAGACIAQAIESGLSGSYVDDATLTIGRPLEMQPVGIDGDIWSSNKQAALWKIYQENSWGSGEGDCPIMSDYR